MLQILLATICGGESPSAPPPGTENDAKYWLNSISGAILDIYLGHHIGSVYRV